MTIPTFPTNLPGKTFPLTRSVIWSTLKHRAVSGKGSALQQWTAPIYRYEFPYSFLRSGSQAELQTLEAFYNSVGGDAQLFQFYDTDDHTATTQVFGQGDDVTTEYQLVRAFGGFVAPVYCVTITNIFIDGVATGAYTESNGLITFTVAPASPAVLSWTGLYNWPARFDDGNIDFAKFAGGFYALDKLSFTTDRL